ncbi:MAG: Ger(x)C family spore germination protein [Acetobacter sp.]|nr:Ger(x)C family spore germination protein [Bacteroides sp.]MCM1340999.1 Ger(x)C family spore germination protein [Acetobacter sp.]MCM1432445.1 Ger(x)C family spore germination protein [Clostridiales bacterium]
MNKTNLKDIVVVEGMAIDKSEDESSKLELTVQTLNVAKNASNGEAPSGNMTLNISGNGNTIVDAAALMSKKLSKNLFYGQTKLIVFSEEMAKDGLADDFDYFLRSSHARSDLAVCISADKSKYILESNENDSRVPSENLLYLMKNGELAGVSAYVTTSQLLNQFEDKVADCYLPVLKPDKDNKNVQTQGIAVFNGDKLSYILNDDETMGFLLISNLVHKCTLEFDDAQFGKVGVEISNIKVKNAADVKNSNIVFSTDLSASLIINEVEKGSVTKLDSRDEENICHEAEQYVKKLCSDSFYACQNAESDCFRVGEYTAKDLPETYSTCEKDWKSYYSSADYFSSVKMDLKKLSENNQQ